MKTIIAGSRSINDYSSVVNAIKDSGFSITEVVSGGAQGVDSLGEKYAKENNIPLKVFNANWDLYGKSAGYIRNKEMSLYSDSLIAVYDGVSKGTAHMINLANEQGLKVYVMTMQILKTPKELPRVAWNDNC